MLSALSIRNLVLIEALDLEFGRGLTVLTGETGAGKTILLDALGFVLGRKVRRDLVRPGADSASVNATFELGGDHPVRPLLEDHGLDGVEEALILRRTTAIDGPSRAFVNDQRVNADTLARIGALLVEVHGQHDDRSLLDQRAHRPLLDAFGGLDTQVSKVRVSWAALRDARAALDAARASIETDARDAEYLRHAVDELERLAPEAGEDAVLDAERRLIRNAGQLGEEIARADGLIGHDGAEGALLDALSRLGHIADRAEGRLEPVIEALDRVMAELSEAQARLGEARDALDADPHRLETVEERLFAIRAQARKHQVQPDELADHAKALAARLAEITAREDDLPRLESAVGDADVRYQADAKALSKQRAEAAVRLDAAVTAELAPLRMEAARFRTVLEAAEPGSDGTDRVSFAAQINPGTPEGLIDRIASGGELSRFLLAMKVQLAARSAGLTLIFDEIDRGVGGATADAVGRRLARLADNGQVLVVTHSPQVAAQGDRHFRIAKASQGGTTRTDVELLRDSARDDEIARMLAGDQITDEARSAARSLINAAR